MNIIIKNAEIYSPKYIGKKDILILKDKIISIEDKISEDFDLNFLNFKPTGFKTLKT